MVAAARGATRLSRRGVQDACMSSHAVGARSNHGVPPRFTPLLNVDGCFRMTPGNSNGGNGVCGPQAPTLKMGCRRGERVGYGLRIRDGAQALLRTSILNSSDERRCPNAVRFSDLASRSPRDKEQRNSAWWHARNWINSATPS